jgi:hypothetical protein
MFYLTSSAMGPLNPELVYHIGLNPLVGNLNANTTNNPLKLNDGIESTGECLHGFANNHGYSGALTKQVGYPNL